MSGESTHDVQLLKLGVFTHPQYGDLEVKLSDLQSMVKNFADKVRGIDLAIDYAHENDKVAAGWIESLYLGGKDQNELWAKVRWTPNGAGAIQAKEYRYLSAEFQFSYTNNETNQTFGPTLLGAGLTNRPFIKGMEPIVELSEKPKGTPQMDEKDKKIAELQKQIEDLKAQLDKAVSDDNKEDASKPDQEMDMGEMKKKLADMSAENDKLKADAAKACEEKKLAEKKSQFDKMLSENKVVEAQREHFMSGDMIKFSESFVKPNISGAGHSGEAPASVSNAAEAQKEVVKLAEALVKEGKAKSIGEAQNKVLIAHPELSKKIYS